MRHAPALIFAVVGLLGALGALSRPALAAGDAERVQAIFARACTECHGPQLARPKAKLGYITDLGRLVSEGHITPGQPGDSELFKLLVTTNPEYVMPPTKAKFGPLKPEEIELVRAWIASGAPAAAAMPGDTDAEPTNGGAPGSASPGRDGASAPSVKPGPGRGGAAGVASGPGQSLGNRLLAFSGKFHPVVVHFPIALLLVAALAEMLVMFRFARAERMAEVVRFLLPLGATAAVVSTVLGLIAASTGGYSTETIFVHRLLGIVASVLALAAWGLWAGQKTMAYRIALLAAAALTGLAGHFGGVIVYGADHFGF